ncbi:hypothetical protein CON53_28980 [Bacillus cereus]|nr:hypothetical protein ICG_05354 [Bacillus cereus BAG1X1-3]EOO75395.1 hypothetical protein IC7_05254 [Bacillus cereus BAG1O-1]PDY08395.1 hypothetical protein COM83_32465 [Bacillus cereus]SEB23035.1 hypothetical protein SAMN04488146_1561 [Bacillus nitratireducens]PEA23247.1 hypothetical protein CON44_32445 [Bacillus cereus]
MLYIAGPLLYKMIIKLFNFKNSNKHNPVLKLGRDWGTAEIRVILSHMLTFISKYNQNRGFSMIFKPIIIHPNHAIKTKYFQ